MGWAPLLCGLWLLSDSGPSPTPLAELAGVSVRFRPSWAAQLFQLGPGPGSRPAALQGVSLVVEPRSVVAVCGSSGAGKTMILNLCDGRVQPSDGSVAVNSTPCWLDAGRITALEGALQRSATLEAAFEAVGPAPARLLHALGLDEEARTPWSSLGSAARVQASVVLAVATDLARAESAAGQPLSPVQARPLVLLDELCDWRSAWAPTSCQLALDQALRRVCSALDGAVLFSTHLPHHARLADAVLHMNDGRALGLADPSASTWFRLQPGDAGAG